MILTAGDRAPDSDSETREPASGPGVERRHSCTDDNLYLCASGSPLHTAHKLTVHIEPDSDGPNSTGGPGHPSGSGPGPRPGGLAGPHDTVTGTVAAATASRAGRVTGNGHG